MMVEPEICSVEELERLLGEAVNRPSRALRRRMVSDAWKLRRIILDTGARPEAVRFRVSRCEHCSGFELTCSDGGGVSRRRCH